MSTITSTITGYTITGDTDGGFVVLFNGEPLRNGAGITRYFATRSSARKAITRERRRNS